MFVCWCLVGGFERLLAMWAWEWCLPWGGHQTMYELQRTMWKDSLGGVGQGGRGCHVGMGAARRGLVWVVPGRNYGMGPVLVLYVGGELLAGISRGGG